MCERETEKSLKAEASGSDRLPGELAVSDGELAGWQAWAAGWVDELDLRVRRPVERLARPHAEKESQRETTTLTDEQRTERENRRNAPGIREAAAQEGEGRKAERIKLDVLDKQQRNRAAAHHRVRQGSRGCRRHGPLSSFLFLVTVSRQHCTCVKSLVSCCVLLDQGSPRKTRS